MKSLSNEVFNSVGHRYLSGGGGGGSANIMLTNSRGKDQIEVLNLLLIRFYICYMIDGHNISENWCLMKGADPYKNGLIHEFWVRKCKKKNILGTTCITFIQIFIVHVQIHIIHLKKKTTYKTIKMFRWIV